MPDNQHFVSGGIDNFVTMWDIEGNKVLLIFFIWGE